MDQSLLSPRIPYELITQIIMLLLLHPAFSRHPSFTYNDCFSLLPFTANKKLYKEAQKLLKHDGSWTVTEGMHYQHSMIIGMSAPVWLRFHITRLSYTIHLPEMLLIEGFVQTHETAIRKIGTAFPNLQVVSVTVSFSDHFISWEHCINNDFSTTMCIFEDLEYGLPARIMHRSMRLTTAISGPVTAVSGISDDIEPVDMAYWLYQSPNTVFELEIPPYSNDIKTIESEDGDDDDESEEEEEGSAESDVLMDYY